MERPGVNHVFDAQRRWEHTFVTVVPWYFAPERMQLVAARIEHFTREVVRDEHNVLTNPNCAGNSSSRFFTRRTTSPWKRPWLLDRWKTFWRGTAPCLSSA